MFFLKYSINKGEINKKDCRRAAASCSLLRQFPQQNTVLSVRFFQLNGNVFLS